MSDLCWICQHNSAAIMRSTNLPIERQTAALQEATQHIDLVRKEREYYRSILNEAATLLEGLFTDPVTGLYSPPLSTPLAEMDIMAHYSFDYAQQVHFPSNPLQPGPIYFSLHVISVMESAHWTKQENQPVLIASRPYQVLPRLVLWSVVAEVQEEYGGITA
uniref:Uncharacterized protein n=1 Tax=Amphimedon queenslandica TaxID=400682 RepID=A0A1X7VKN1_AMPQE